LTRLPPHHLPRVQTQAGGGFFSSFRPPATTPPPSHSNASWRWFFFIVSTVCHHYHLPCIQTRAGGGCFRLFRRDCHHTTSLTFKREPEVVYFILLTWLPSPPPPSRPSASRRWFFSVFQHGSHHHLPRIQTRAGGGVFRCFDRAPTTTTSLASKREPEVVLFGGFEGMWGVEKRASWMIGKDTKKEGQGATMTCWSSFPRALANDPPSHL